MNIPSKIHQTWKAKGWNPKTRKWEFSPIVFVKHNDFEKTRRVNREVWFEYVRNGLLYVTDRLREWLDENGYKDVKRNN